jgi:integrase
VPVERVNATLPHVSAQVQAMIGLQLLTGMRSGEVCIMRTGDIDRTGKLWVYRPARYKTKYRGHAREVYLGPKAQQVLAPFLKLDPIAYLFSAAEAEQQRRETMHATRKTPLNCGNRPGTNRKRRPQHAAGERYDVAGYRRAVARACDEAFPPPAHLAPTPPQTRREWQVRLTPEQRDELARWRSDHRWHPHQLRHTAATSLRKTHGVEAAQVILGHKTLTVTQIYAEKNVEAAQRIMAAVG